MIYATDLQIPYHITNMKEMLIYSTMYLHLQQILNIHSLRYEMKTKTYICILFSSFMHSFKLKQWWKGWILKYLETEKLLTFLVIYWSCGLKKQDNHFFLSENDCSKLGKKHAWLQNDHDNCSDNPTPSLFTIETAPPKRNKQQPYCWHWVGVTPKESKIINNW